MRHRPLLYLLTILVALASTVALLGAGLAMGSPRVADPRLAATETVARAFYDAVNQAIATGDTAALDARLADELETHGAVALLAPGRTGLIRYLETVHTTQPQVELSVDQVVLVRDQALVYLTVQGLGEARFLGSPLRGGSPPWGSVDALTVTGQQVVEYWSGASGLAMLESLTETSIAIANPTRRIVSLDRLMIPPGASFAAQGGEEGRLLVVETGAITVTSSRLAIMSNLNEPPPLATIESDTDGAEAHSLSPGEVASLTSWSRTEIHNVGQTPATLLVLAAGIPGVPGGRVGDPAYPSSQPPRDDGTGLPVWQAGMPRISPSGAIVAPLTGGAMTALPGKRAVVAVGRLTLAPGAILPAFEATGPLLLVVEGGTLDLAASGEQAWVSRGDAGRLRVESATLGTANGALLHAGTSATLHNRGREAAVVTIVAILPDGAATDA